MNAASAEPGLGTDEASAFLAEQLLGRKTDVVESDVGVTTTATIGLRVLVQRRAERVDVSHDLEPGGVGVDEEHGGSLEQRLGGIGDRHHDEEVSCHRVRDEPLLPAEDPFVSVARSSALELAGLAGMRLGHRIRRSERSSNGGFEVLLLLGLVAVVCNQLHVPGVGSCAAEDGGAQGCPAEHLVEQAELHLPEPGTAELGTEVKAPQTLILDPVLQRGDVQTERGPRRFTKTLSGRVDATGDVVVEGFHLFGDERLHPVDLFLELGFNFEIDGHVWFLFLGEWCDSEA